MGVLEWLRKRFRITKRELIIGIVLGTQRLGFFVLNETLRIGGGWWT